MFPVHLGQTERNLLKPLIPVAFRKSLAIGFKPMIDDAYVRIHRRLKYARLVSGGDLHPDLSKMLDRLATAQRARSEVCRLSCRSVVLPSLTVYISRLHQACFPMSPVVSQCE